MPHAPSPRRHAWPVFALLTAVAVAGCDDSPTALPSADAPAVFAAAPLRPIQGDCHLTFEVLEVNFPVLRQRDYGTCQLSHLGRTGFDGILEINLLLGMQTGTRTFTAANGDELYATVAGTSAPIGPGLIGFSATFTFTGGTGRFANASGSAQGEGVANQVTQTTMVRLEGSIGY